jgi:excisionase family DNA binding protein
MVAAINSANGIPQVNGEWLSLRDACRLLDVSDTTLRQWADAGHLRVYRTPGGHRRFLREDVELLTRSPRPTPEPAREDSREAPALRRIRRRLSQDSVTQQPWFQAVEPEGHDRMRLFGRRLLSLLMQESGPRRRRQELLAEARMLGQEYGSEMLERNVALTDSVEAFVFFRTMVLDSAPAASWSRILETSDKVLAGLCASYQQSAAPGISK